MNHIMVILTSTFFYLINYIIFDSCPFFYEAIQSDIDRLELERKTLKQTIALKKAYQLSDEAKKIELKKYLYEAIKDLCNQCDRDLIRKFVKKICIYPDNTCDIEIVAHSNGSPGLL